MEDLFDGPMEKRTSRELISPQVQKIHRRKFLVGSVKVSLAFLGLDAVVLPTFAQENRETPGADREFDRFNVTKPPANLDDSLNIMAAYLVQYRPPAQEFPTTGAWKAKYDVLEWLGSANVPMDRYFRRNQVIGHQILIRQPNPHTSEVTYDLEYLINLRGYGNTLESTMRCSGKPIPGLVDWHTDYAKYAIGSHEAPVGLTESGRCTDGVLETSSRAGTRRLHTERVVAPQWAIMDALRNSSLGARDPITQVEFDLLYDLTSYRPRQRLNYGGILKMDFEDQSYMLHGFVQTGMGTQPTHYWIDSAGRPLLFTGGLISSALTSIKEV